MENKDKIAIIGNAGIGRSMSTTHVEPPHIVIDDVSSINRDTLMKINNGQKCIIIAADFGNETHAATIAAMKNLDGDLIVVDIAGKTAKELQDIFNGHLKDRVEINRLIDHFSEPIKVCREVQFFKPKPNFIDGTHKSYKRKRR